MSNLIKPTVFTTIIVISVWTECFSQITLASFKKLSADEQQFQAEFFEKNKYEFDESVKSPNGPSTLFRYLKQEKNIIKAITTVSGKKLVIWTTNNNNTYENQKAFLFSEKYVTIDTILANKKFPCFLDDGFTGGIVTPGDKKFGIPSYKLFSSGYLLLTVEGIIDKERIYIIALFHPSLCLTH